MRYRRIYAMLQKLGHAPSDAEALVLNAVRGDRHARLWIVTARKVVRKDC